MLYICGVLPLSIFIVSFIEERTGLIMQRSMQSIWWAELACKWKGAVMRGGWTCIDAVARVWLALVG